MLPKYPQWLENTKDSSGDQVDTEEWGGKVGRMQENIKKEGHWKIDNVKWRKREMGEEEEEENSCRKSKEESNECDQAQPNSMRTMWQRRRIEKEVT